MAGVTPESVVDYIISLLNSTIQDPLSSRAASGKNWIFPGMPTIGLDTPRLGVKFLVGDYDYGGCGGVRLCRARLQISCRSRKDQRIDVNDDGVAENAYGICDHLLDTCVQVIMDNREDIRETAGLVHLTPEQLSDAVEESTTIFQKATLEALWEKTPT